MVKGLNIMDIFNILGVTSILLSPDICSCCQHPREGVIYAVKKHPLNGKDHVAYDLTTVLFFGTSCPLAEFGYNPGHLELIWSLMSDVIGTIRKTKVANVYATLVKGNIYGMERNIVVDPDLEPSNTAWYSGW